MGINTPKASQDEESTIIFAVDEWCPQHCQKDKNREGYIVDIIKEIFALENIPIEITYLPWLRAIIGTRDGTFAGLLTPTKISNPELLFHSRPIGYQEYCIYVKKSSSWKYSDISSFKNTSVVYLED